MNFAKVGVMRELLLRLVRAGLVVLAVFCMPLFWLVLWAAERLKHALDHLDLAIELARAERKTRRGSNNR
jgi:hypothetical protein